MSCSPFLVCLWISAQSLAASPTAYSTITHPDVLCPSVTASAPFMHTQNVNTTKTNFARHPDLQNFHPNFPDKVRQETFFQSNYHPQVLTSSFQSTLHGFPPTGRRHKSILSLHMLLQELQFDWDISKNQTHWKTSSPPRPWWRCTKIHWWRRHKNLWRKHWAQRPYSQKVNKYSGVKF